MASFSEWVGGKLNETQEQGLVDKHLPSPTEIQQLRTVVSKLYELWPHQPRFPGNHDEARKKGYYSWADMVSKENPAVQDFERVQQKAEKMVDAMIEKLRDLQFEIQHMDV